MCGMAAYPIRELVVLVEGGVGNVWSIENKVSLFSIQVVVVVNLH